MHKNDFSQLPVFSHSTCVGLVTEHSITKYLIESKGKSNVYNAKVEKIMDFPPPIIDSNYKITPLLLEFLSDHNCLLVSENGKLTSILTKIDVIRGVDEKTSKKDKEKIKELITQCKIYRYSTDETLNYLKENDHYISDRTLRRIKNEMNSKISERFLNMIKHEHVDEILHSIDTLKKIEKEYWKLLSKNPSVNERIKIFDSIHKTQETLLIMINEVPFVQKMKDAIDSRFAEIEKLQKNSK